MKQVKARAGTKVVQRIAVVACVAILGVGAAGCGDNSGTPQAPTPTQAPAAGVTTPPTTASAQSGGSGF